MRVTELDIDRIHAAFSPKREIQNPKLFVGRRKEMRAAIDALHETASLITVLGLRGVGKSSVAYQLKLLAEGDTYLAEALGLGRFLPKKHFNFLVHYVRCDSFVVDIERLLWRLLLGDESNPSLFSLTAAGDKRLKEFKQVLKTEGEAGFFAAKIGASGEQEKTFETYFSNDTAQQFRALLGTIRKEHANRTGLLFIIDEFDQIKDKTAFGSLLKALSPEPFVRFCIVGIASTVSELVADHESIGRQLSLIKVPLMPYNELIGILDRAEEVVRKAICFGDKARELIARKAEGFPYFVHLLGKEAMLHAFDRRSPEVDGDEIEYIAQLVSEGRLQTMYEEIYHEAVKHSPQREVLLKIFAEQQAEEISTEPVYSLAKEMGISNPPQLMSDLTGGEKGAGVLIKVRPRFYRFSDPVFKVYARLRQWKY